MADWPPPFAIDRDLTYIDALLGQFELVCCDAAAAFIASEVLGCGDNGYLQALFEKISASPEFQPVSMTIVQIPKNDAGQKFADQFMGFPAEMLPRLPLPIELKIPFKKARIMKHWAGRIGAALECNAILE